MTTATFTLPVPPPSVNGIYANVPGRGRIKTKKYRAWKDATARYVASLKIKRFEKPVIVNIVLPKSARGDGDNRCKAALDCLKAAGVIVDDNLNRVPMVTVSRSSLDDFTTITISEAS